MELSAYFIFRIEPAFTTKIMIAKQCSIIYKIIEN
jgi:hypothetical protein